MSASEETRFWHPFAQMSSVKAGELVIERGDGVWVFDTDGRRYLDATASLWYANVGHGRREIADAVHEQMSRLEAYSAFGDFGNAPASELCARLASIAPMDGARVFLGSGGGDGVDTATKIARRFWAERGSPDRVHVLTRTHAYHGTHGHGTSLAGIEANRVGWGPLDTSMSRVPWDSAEALERTIDEIGPDRVAAFFLEPVIGAGGVLPPPPGYVEAVARTCRRTGVLLVVDAVICGFGRLGTWFGVERWPEVEPDMIVFAKGVTSGYLPLGGVVVSGRVAEPFWDGTDAPMFRHGATYAGHASCCAAALANLDVIEREGLLERGRLLEDDLLDALRPLEEHPLVGSVRGGCGLLAAVDFSAEALAANPGAPAEAGRRARSGGVIVRPLLSGLAVSPPLIATPEHFELVTEAMSTALDEMATATTS